MARLTPGTISAFRSSFTKELARPNRFDVLIPMPAELAKTVGGLDSMLRYRCENAQLPSRTFATTEQKTYGPIEKYPYLNTYNDLELTFIVSDDMTEKYIFDNWMELINPTSTNDFAYKSEYATMITVNQYNLQNNLTYAADFFDAYPISINQLDLDWSQNDSYHKLTVTFAYTRWFNRTED